MSQTTHKFKIGDCVNHIDIDQSIFGVIVDIGYLGQIEHMEIDFDLNKKYEDETEDSTIVESPEEYYQPWYRILWINDPDLGYKQFETPTRKFNGQECEEVLRLVQVYL